MDLDVEKLHERLARVARLDDGDRLAGSKYLQLPTPQTKEAFVCTDLFRLNRDCWLRIFCFLDVASRVRSERVSRCLKALFGELWHTELHTSFDVASVKPPRVDIPDDVPWETCREICEANKARWVAAAVGLCRHVGDAFDHLVIRARYPTAHIQAIYIFDACPCVESVDFVTAGLNGEGLSGISFAPLVALRRLNFARRRANVRTLESVPRSVEIVIGLIPGDDVDADDIAAFIRTHSELRILKMLKNFGSSFAADRVNLFELVTDHCTRLERLRVDSWCISAEGFSRLRNLRELEVRLLRNEPTVHEFCAALAGCPCLEVLSLGDKYAQLLCQSIFDTIARQRLPLARFEVWDYSIAKPKAAYNSKYPFNLSCLRTLLRACGATLRSFSFASTPQIDDEWLALIADLCTDLRYLYISDCGAMSGAAFRGLIDAVVAAPEWRAGVDTLKIDGWIRCETLAAKNEISAMRQAEMPDGVQFVCVGYVG